MGRHHFAVVLPQRIGHDIGDDDGLAAIDGGAAGTHLGTDADAVDGFCIGFRQARRCAMPEGLAILVKQQDGAKYAAQLGFNETHETVEHFAQGWRSWQSFRGFAPVRRASCRRACVR